MCVLLFKIKSLIRKVSAHEDLQDVCCGNEKFLYEKSTRFYFLKEFY